MKKIIFSLTVLCLIAISALPAYSTSLTNFSKTKNGNVKKEISIGTNRASGEMLLRFTAHKEGAASITIINESGKIVWQQTNQVRSSINIIPLKNAILLSEGSYTVRLIVNNETYTKGLLIWK
ncbi:MAG: T9SS type A sorting domain-containing protein [Ferruginibacter sp.]|nr:T9SS type A sorting domain-containing protein [Ferruginibacter sp.]